MRTLRSILGDWWLDVTSQRDVKAGNSGTAPTLSSRDVDRLRKSLTGAIRANRGQFQVIFALAALLVIMTAVAPLLMDGQSPPAWVRSLAGGGTLVFLIVLLRLWRETTALEMMVIIATYLQGEAMVSLVAVIRERLRPWGFKDLDGLVRRHTSTDPGVSQPADTGSRTQT